MSLRPLLFKLYWKLENTILPGFEGAQSFYENVLINNIKVGSRWLDLGCGRKLLPSWSHLIEGMLVSRCKYVVGLDYDLKALKDNRSISHKVRGDILNLPFNNSSFHVVTANMVLEHLIHPKTQFEEIHRILRPGGLFIFHTPNLLSCSSLISKALPEFIKKMIIRILEGRSSIDIFPTYYRSNTQNRICLLARQARFTLIDIFMCSTPGTFVVFPILLLPELVWMRILQSTMLKRYMPNMISILMRKE